jgi:type IV fimbrial biogenesis protein FimT
VTRPCFFLAHGGPGRAAEGFTLIELMVTMSILVIVTVLAVPSFQSAFLSNKLATYTNNFVGSIQFARGEAIKRNAIVRICRRERATDGTPTCSDSGTWQKGWFVWVDASADGNLQASEILREQDALSSDYTFCTDASGACSTDSAAYALQFKPTGLDTTGYDFILCREAGKAKRKITLMSTARTALTAYSPPASQTNSCP